MLQKGMTTIQIDYDDDTLAVISKINQALAPHCLELEDDNEDHDGFIILNLVELRPPNSPIP